MARRTGKGVLVAATVLALSVGATVLGQSDEPPLQVGVTGSAPTAQRKNPTYVLASAEVQRLILEIAENPRERDYVEAALGERDFTLEDMVDVGLLRREGDRYRIDFNLLLVEDHQAIVEAAELLGRDLAHAFLARRSRFEEIAEDHGWPRVDWPRLFYVVLGCFSLDWDGLDLTRERGWRAGAQRTLDGRSFTPWAKERGAETSLRGLYWGSHNQPRSVVTFTTFGDHHSLPRFGLPDLLWNRRDGFQVFADVPEGRRLAEGVFSGSPGDELDDVGSVMLALREVDLGAHELAARTGIEVDRLEGLLSLLELMGYVVRSDGVVRGSATVLGPQDADLVREMLAEGREIMAAWHEANYAGLRDRLSDLTPGRNGVPFERVYTEVWHYVFAIANRTLVERGFFADPYAEGRRFKGFLPAVWANGLDELTSAP